jgi:pseudouridine-5'-monophosphatase
MGPRVEYVIFDMDGLLIDSEKIYTLATNNILKPYGVQMDWNIKAGCMGVPELAAAKHLLGSYPKYVLEPPSGNPPPLTIESYLLQRNKLQDELWPEVPLLPGAEKLVKHLVKHNIPIAVATGSRREKFYIKTQTGREAARDGQPKTAKQMLFELFGDRVVCADDDTDIPCLDGSLRKMQGKPNPDVFLVAAERALGKKVGFEPKGTDGITTEQVEERIKGLVFEDALPGALAGIRSGMNVVWIPDPNLREIEEKSKTDEFEPHQILNSLVEFVPEEWGLPPYDE